MIPGKKYTPEDYLRMAWGRRWLIILPFLTVALGTAVYAHFLPNRYRAETLVLIVPQRVPEDYVQSTVTTQLQDRLQMISQQILSRTRLERIIQEFNLYPDERKTVIMEDLIERMRTKHIKVGIVNPARNREEATAFTVSYESDSARTAMLVTERLASLFIKENLEDRAVLADATNQFLETQLEDARRRLIEHEKKLEAYRSRNSGSLPTQLSSNLQAMQNAQLQLTAVQESINRDRDRKVALERMIADGRLEVATSTPSATEEGRSQGTAAQQLAAARSALQGMQLRLKAEHPDVIKLKRTIVTLEQLAETEALAQPLAEKAAPVGPVSSAEVARRVRMTELQTELENLDRRAAGRLAEEQRLKDAITMYQLRVDAAPSRESELVELMRDYDTIKLSYTSLLQKNEASKIAVNLERRQIGEQFKVLDGARLPEKAISPDRFRMNLTGAVAGLVLGLALVGFLEYRDTSLKTDDDVTLAFGLPVLAQIPALTTRDELRFRKRRRLLLACSSVVIGAAGIVAAAWKLQLFEGWIR